MVIVCAECGYIGSSTFMVSRSHSGAFREKTACFCLSDFMAIPGIDDPGDSELWIGFDSIM